MRYIRFSKASRQSGLTWGGITLLTALLLLCLTPRPAAILWMVSSLSLLPPLWLLTVLHLCWYFAVGFTVGCLFSVSPGRAWDGLFWRGATMLLLGMTMAAVWYILLFGKGLILLSGLFLLPCGGAMAMTALCWRFRYPAVALSVVVCALWPIFLFGCQLVCILSA